MYISFNLEGLFQGALSQFVTKKKEKKGKKNVWLHLLNLFFFLPWQLTTIYNSGIINSFLLVLIDDSR